MAEDYLSKILMHKSMVICCGSGGVGKTTTSAVLALQAAVMGRKALVLTIDPARRLANALGLPELGNQIRRIDPEYLKKSGLEVTGEISAMMLDSKRTFDALVEKFAPSTEKAQTILDNQYYQHLSRAMTGSHEYMAMEKLYELHEQQEFDLIVLDTPPTHNALDFLDAPLRVTRLLDDSIIKWFLKPYFAAGKFSFKTAKAGSKIIFKILEKVTGLQVLKDISEFFLAFSGMYEGFRLRADRVHAMLKDTNTAFLLVTSPNQVTINECTFFYNKLQELAFPIEGMLVNRVHADDGVNLSLGYEGLLSELKNQMGAGTFHSHEEFFQRLMKNACYFQRLFELDQMSMGQLLKQTDVNEKNIRTIPYFEDDVYDIPELKRMMQVLFPQETPLH